MSLGAGCGAASGTAAEPGAPGTGRIDSLVLQSAEGGHFDLADLRGKPTIIALFTTYNLYAQQVLVMLGNVWARRSTDGLEVVAISSEPEALELLRAYRESLALPFTVLRGDADVHEGRSPLGHLETVPLLLFVDRTGTIVARVARVDDEEALDAAAERLIGL